jgi:hypothetical protein
LRGELGDGFVEQSCVRKFLALPVKCLVSTCTLNEDAADDGSRVNTYFMIRTTAASTAKPRESWVFFYVFLGAMWPSTGFAALLVAFDLVAGADNADLDLDELALEVLVE